MRLGQVIVGYPSLHEWAFFAKRIAELTPLLLALIEGISEGQTAAAEVRLPVGLTDREHRRSVGYGFAGFILSWVFIT